MEKFYLNLETVGNTTSASIPLCQDKAVRKSVLRPVMRIAMAGFGAGHIWAGRPAQWPSQRDKVASTIDILTGKR